MTFRQYLVIMLLGTLLCWTAWGVVLFTVDPQFATLPSFVFFYLSLFLSLIGTVSMLACWWLYIVMKQSQPMYRLVARSFRFACFISFAMTVLLILQGVQLLTIWNGTVFVIAMSFLSAFLLVHHKRDSGTPNFYQ